jgi:hypothetical protein
MKSRSETSSLKSSVEAILTAGALGGIRVRTSMSLAKAAERLSNFL